MFTWRRTDFLDGLSSENKHQISSNREDTLSTAGWNCRHPLPVLIACSFLAIGSVQGVSAESVVLSPKVVRRHLGDIGSAQPVLRFDNQGLIVVTGRGIYSFSVPSLKTLSSNPFPEGATAPLMVSLGKRTGFFLSASGYLYQFAIASGAYVKVYPRRFRNVSCIGTNENSSVAVLATFDGSCYLVSNGRSAVMNLPRGTNGVNSIAIASSVNQGLIGCNDGSSYLFDLRTRRILGRAKRDFSVGAVAFDAGRAVFWQGFGTYIQPWKSAGASGPGGQRLLSDDQRYEIQSLQFFGQNLMTFSLKRGITPGEEPSDPKIIARRGNKIDVLGYSQYYFVALNLSLHLAAFVDSKGDLNVEDIAKLF